MKPNHSILQYYLPKKMSKHSLDRYLAAGWFRTTNMLFRSKIACFDNDVCSPINIRLRLSDHVFSKSLRKLLRRNNQQFRYEIKKATIDAEKEELFLEHQKRFRSFLCNNLQDFLVLSPHFDTYEIDVYDEDRLIAVSFFDMGQSSMMSLLGIFDARYSLYSLGIYTMLLEIEFSKASGHEWYYPGYVHERPSIYDYKLRLGTMQIYNWQTNRWGYKISHLQIPNAASTVKKQTNLISGILRKLGVEHQLKINLFFGWHYYHHLYDRLFKCPLMLILNDGTVIAYDAEDRKYIHLTLEIYIPFRDINLPLANDFDKKIHCMDVMKENVILFETNSLKEFSRYLSQNYGDFVFKFNPVMSSAFSF
jgi:leucyl-tRNA---protein transferase